MLLAVQIPFVQARYILQTHTNYQMEWNDHKQQLLTRYVEDYADSLLDPLLFFQRIDWQHLLKTLDVHNLELLQLKVDELYDSRFSGFEAGENVNIAEIVDHWKKKRNPLFREVARMIESLGLESFETESPRSENVPNISTSSVANVRRTDVYKRQGLLVWAETFI